MAEEKTGAKGSIEKSVGLPIEILRTDSKLSFQARACRSLKFALNSRSVFCRRGVLLAFVFANIVVAAQQPPTPPERAAMIRARRMFYSLQLEGVRELRCEAHPDWPQVLESMLGTGANAKARALPYLSKVEFKVVMTSSGTSVTLVQNEQRPPTDLANGLEKLIELIRQNVQEPMDMWRMVTFTPLIPSPEQSFRLLRKEGGYNVMAMGRNPLSIEVDKNWMVREIRTTAPEGVTLTLQPHYIEMSKGFLLSILDIRNIAEPKQYIHMTFEYLEKEDLELPSAFASRSEHPGGIVSIPVKFDNYEILRP